MGACGAGQRRRAWRGGRIAKQLRGAGAFVVAAVAIGAAVLATGAPASPSARQAATCTDYSTQAEAQRAADTRDTDGDGIYCEALPCPCLKPGSTGGGAPRPAPRPPP